MIDHRSYIHNKIKPENIQAWTEFDPINLCDTSAVLYQLSYQANWTKRIVQHFEIGAET